MTVLFEESHSRQASGIFTALAASTEMSDQIQHLQKILMALTVLMTDVLRDANDGLAQIASKYEKIKSDASKIPDATKRSEALRKADEDYNREKTLQQARVNEAGRLLSQSSSASTDLGRTTETHYDVCKSLMDMSMTISQLLGKS
jgi:hypothetical protein